ncbi:hypothetical protein [Domibacillus epiphyticus]|nr:hypothetical protein [Domibacillus epiphyticus]
MIDTSKIESPMLACLKDERERQPPGMVTPFAAEEAVGKMIAIQLKEK